MTDLISVPVEQQSNLATQIMVRLESIDEMIDQLDNQGVQHPDFWPVILPTIEVLVDLRAMLRSLIF